MYLWRALLSRIPYSPGIPYRTEVQPTSRKKVPLQLLSQWKIWESKPWTRLFSSYCPTSSGRYLSTSVGKKWTLDDIANVVSDPEKKNVIVMAGAGISTPSGLPDFRSPGTGLYDNLERFKLPYPEAIFDIYYFNMDQRPFFALAQELYPGNFKPNICHHFVRLLQDKGKLLRMYTQNIDGLERLGGIVPQLLVEAHGTFATATCIKCQERYGGDKIRDTIMKGDIPKCTIKNCKGVIKPDIVFFGEQLPMRFWTHMADMREADLLIVMGTSLEVEPFASIAEVATWETPRLLINRDVVGSFRHSKRPMDVVVEGDVVAGVQKLSEILGWVSELKTLEEVYDKKIKK